MRGGFKHLSYTDRLKIEAKLNEGKKPTQIAAELRVHHCTIYREIKREQYEHKNSDWTHEMRYSPDLAEERYRLNLAAKGAELKIGKDHKLAQHIEKKVLKDKFSPAAIVGEIKRDGLKFSTEICEKTIYNYIDKGVFLHITNKDLPEKGKKKRTYKKVRAKRAPRGESIEKRPPEVNARNTFGHWEMDCVEGKQGTKKTLLVLSERLTRDEIIIKLPSQTTVSVVAALDRLERRFGRFFPEVFKTITVDNGSEFSNYDGMEQSKLRKKKKRTQVFYCHPRSPQERGTNENINKMIRRHFPKGTDFEKISAATIKKVEQWINDYPREILGFFSSATMFQKHLVQINQNLS